MSARALHEIYLMPFMLAQKHAQPWSCMTAFGTFSVDHALNAGVDLEIPGVGKWRTLEYVKRSIQARKVPVTATTVKQRAKKVLELVQKCAQKAPEILDCDGAYDGIVNAIKQAGSSATEVTYSEGTRAPNTLPLGNSHMPAINCKRPPAKIAIPTTTFGVRIPRIVYKSLPSLELEIFTPSGERGWIGHWHCNVNDSLTRVPTPG